MSASLSNIVNDPPLLLAVCEQLVPSMNGKAMRRLTCVLDELAAGDQLDDIDRRWLTDALPHAVSNRDRWVNELTRLRDTGVELVACTDPGYPTNLKLVHDRPPVLFVHGQINSEDQRAVAVVGTRQASQEGIKTAACIAEGLILNHYTVVSGLAHGIDTAAHTATVRHGDPARTVAVFGTPINEVYPAANRGLARRIAEHGACVSQFLPGVSTGRWAFPARNRTTSGLALGVVVVEGAENSGSHQTAQVALGHGKQVFLTESLVAAQRWAQQMAAESLNTTVVSYDADEIVEVLEADLAVDGDTVFV